MGYVKRMRKMRNKCTVYVRKLAWKRILGTALRRRQCDINVDYELLDSSGSGLGAVIGFYRLSNSVEQSPS